MKKNFYIITAAALSLVACSRNQEIDVPDANLSLFARTESPADTKTVVESGVHVYWEPGDEIAVFMGDQSAKFATDITAASETATFKGTFGDATWPEDLDLWAVYPFSEDAVFDGETITTTLPSEQVAREGSFGKDMNLAIAHSNSSTLQFYNVGGGIRFSVTEEGIKKVMFEGLSGEIIAGKVKIGMDENGKPEVREVTGGSQFITLLPPIGKETFEPGAWYYIVAIPGYLEGGYKLRFYKDSDYARKVSDKKVEIKRSIFGSLEKADTGLVFEATTTHFPETKEEWAVSITLTEDITNAIGRIINTSHPDNTAELLDEISRIDGVLSVSLNEMEDVAYIQQKDSSYLNIMLSPEDSSQSLLYVGDNDATLSAITTITARKSSSFLTPVSKKAILLAPYQSHPVNRIEVQLDLLRDLLACAGFSLNPVLDDNADMSQFELDNLRQYDLVLIRSHGVANAKTSKGEITTAISSGQPVEPGLSWEAFVNEFFPRLSKMARCIVSTSDEFVGPYYCMTVPWLNEQLNESTDKLPGSVVYAGACQSFMNDDLKQIFFDLGASAFGGFTDTVAGGVADTGMYRIMNLLSQGTGFKYASSYFYNNDEEGDLMRNYLIGTNKGVDEPRFSHKLYNYKINPKMDISDYYFIESRPENLHFEPNGSDLVFTWTASRPKTYVGEKDRFWKDVNIPVLELPCYFDIYIGDDLVSSVENVCQTVIPSISPGTYDWHVVSRIMNGKVVCASFQSSTEPFTVIEQIPAPPQVETFPASVDAQKAFLSGMVTNRSLEGLETGFYYYKLTAQEGSTELSASEKERLVMGGKKVLSAGDYKDYFGIDLTDIEQDSKYLFVAYATDEYSQTGKGEVLSFTTGSPSVHVSSVSLNMSSLELGVGNTATLVATVLPENASNKKVTWSSSDESRATVSSQGVVKGISMGNAVITVTTEDGGKTAQCNVSVTQSTVHVQSVSLNKTDLVLTVGNSETLVATVLPENAANKSVTWTSSNPSKATVSSTGVVTGVAEGAAVVTATTVDGGKTASCFVTVRKAAQPDPGESGNALIELSCDELDWGDVEIGNNVTKTFTVKNTGTTALNISSVSIVATDNTVNPSYFSILPNSSSTVSPGNSLAFNVTFIPEAECGYYAIVSIKSNASNATEGTSTVWLTGVGIKASSSHSVETPEIVDLGLSVKWASFNLGATEPEEYGDYFAWGETEPYYSSLNPLTWKDGKEAGYDWPSYKYGTYDENNSSDNGMIKYNATDGKVYLDPEDDAAYKSLGGMWRMPTKGELEELQANCRWTRTKQNGVNGRLVTGPNGNSIFLPAAGRRFSTFLDYPDSDGGYWSSTRNSDTPNNAYTLYFWTNHLVWFDSNRCFGQSIRPVFGERGVPVKSVLLSESVINLYVAEHTTLIATILPENATIRSLIWKSSDTSIASVSSAGVVKGVTPGSATITVTTVDGGMTASCNVTVKEASSPVSVPDAIDLGLSVKWASFNLGATKPEEHGYYYSWGETEIKGAYHWGTYKWCTSNSYGSLTKYVPCEWYNSIIDNKTELDPEDDVVFVKLGGKWRMPLDAEWTELRENCTWIWTTENGVNGYRVTSNKAGYTDKSIFLPAAGQYRDEPYRVGSYGYYLSSSVYIDIPSNAYGVYFYSTHVYRYDLDRADGNSIRPIYDE